MFISAHRSTARSLRSDAPAPPSIRVALYSHDTQGLGHVRRNLAIAGALAAGPCEPELLLLSGVREATAFALPPRTDCLTLPAIAKSPTGRYGPRALSLPLERLVRLRAGAIAAALEGYEPDVLIVDKVARGALGELQPALDALAGGGRTRVVLGLRDVLDDAVTTRAEWRADRTTEAIEQHYDAVWVYGDPTVYDPVTEYGLPASVADKVRFTGYLAPARAPLAERDRVPGLPDLPGPYDLCLVGGGQDGLRVAASFLAAPGPEDMRRVVVAGPYMAAEARIRLDALAAARPGSQVLGFVQGCSALIRRAGSVVAMGGYNTVVELLAARSRALVVPRVRPRREQLVRAERLAARGLLDLCHPDDLDRHAVGRWLADAAERTTPGRARIDLHGLRRLPGLLGDLMASAPRSPAATPDVWRLRVAR